MWECTSLPTTLRRWKGSSKQYGANQGGAELLVAVDFNVDLVTPEEDRRVEDIATTLAKEGLEDMARHFLSRESRWCRDQRTGGML